MRFPVYFAEEIGEYATVNPRRPHERLFLIPLTVKESQVAACLMNAPEGKPVSTRDIANATDLSLQCVQGKLKALQAKVSDQGKFLFDRHVKYKLPVEPITPKQQEIMDAIAKVVQEGRIWDPYTSAGKLVGLSKQAVRSRVKWIKKKDPAFREFLNEVTAYRKTYGYVCGELVREPKQPPTSFEIPPQVFEFGNN